MRNTKPNDDDTDSNHVVNNSNYIGNDNGNT